MRSHTLVPLSPYESGGETISIKSCRLGWGTSISQDTAYAAIAHPGYLPDSATGWRRDEETIDPKLEDTSADLAAPSRGLIEFRAR